MTIGIVNPTDQGVDFSLDIAGVKPGVVARKFKISDADPMAYNDPGSAPKIDIRESQVPLNTGKISVVPMSVTVVQIPLL